MRNEAAGYDMSVNSLDIKELTDNGLLETAGLISRREYNLSLVKSRQTAELIVKAYASEKGIEYTGLADTIESLYRAGIINISSRNALHNIRIFGNKAVHEADNDPEDAQKAYYLLKTETQTFMSRKTVSVDRTPVRVDFGRNASSQVSGNDIRSDRTRIDFSRFSNSDDGTSPAERSEDPGKGSEGRRRIGPDSDITDSTSRRGYSGSSSVKKGQSSGSNARRKPQYDRASDRNNDRGRRPSEKAARSSGRSTRPSGSTARKGAGRPSGSTAAFYDIIKIVGPILAIVLIVIIIRGLNIFPSKNKAATDAETTAAVTETQAELQTMAPPVTIPETAPPVYEYRVKGSGVNVRYADNQNRVYTQLSNGTAIGTVTEIEGSDFVQFTLDGISVVINKNYIEPIR